MTVRAAFLVATSLLGLILGTGCDPTFKVFVQEGGEVVADWGRATCTFWHEDGETKDDCSVLPTTFTVGDTVSFEAFAEEDLGYGFAGWDGCDNGIVGVDMTEADTVCSGTIDDESISGNQRTYHLDSADDEDGAWLVATFDPLMAVAIDLEPDIIP